MSLSIKDMAKDIDDKRRERTRAESFNISPVKKNNDSKSMVNAITGNTTGRNLIDSICLECLIKIEFCNS